MNVIELREANAVMGWLAVPPTCPTRFLNRICEKRSVALATHTPIVPIIRSVPHKRSRVSNQVSLEEKYRRQTGREYVSPEAVAIRLATLGLQVKADARAMAAEQAENARAAEQVRNETFPWERN